MLVRVKTPDGDPPTFQLQNSVFDLKSATRSSKLNSVKWEDWFHRSMGLLSKSL